MKFPIETNGRFIEFSSEVTATIFSSLLFLAENQDGFDDTLQTKKLAIIWEEIGLDRQLEGPCFWMWSTTWSVKLLLRCIDSSC